MFQAKYLIFGFLLCAFVGAFAMREGENIWQKVFFESQAVNGSSPSSFFSIHQFDRSITYTDASGAESVKSFKGYKEQNNLFNPIVACRKEIDPGCLGRISNKNFYYDIGHPNGGTEFLKVFIPPGSTEYSLLAYTLGNSDVAFAVARFGKPPDKDMNYDPTPGELAAMATGGGNLSQMINKDFFAKNDSGQLGIVSDYSVNTTGGWLYVMQKTKPGSAIKSYFSSNTFKVGTPTTAGTYLNWYNNVGTNGWEWGADGDPLPPSAACGSWAKAYPAGSTSYGTGSYCDRGSPSATPAFPTAGSTVMWKCLADNGGNNSPDCSASLASVIPCSNPPSNFNNATKCLDADKGLVVATSWTNIPEANHATLCTQVKCRYYCNLGFVYSSSANACVSSTVSITGRCGTADKTYPASASGYGSDKYCAEGTPSSQPPFPADGAVTWTCIGSGTGGNSRSCNAIHYNNAPITPLPANSCVCIQGVACSCQLGAFDPNFNKITKYEFSSYVPQGLGVSNAGLISWSSPLGGPYSVSVKAIDEYGGVSNNFTFTLLVTVTNKKPKVDSVDCQ